MSEIREIKGKLEGCMKRRDEVSEYSRCRFLFDRLWQVKNYIHFSRGKVTVKGFRKQRKGEGRDVGEGTEIWVSVKPADPENHYRKGT